MPAAGADFCGKLRSDTVAYIEGFTPSVWTEDPITTLLNGKPLTGGTVVETVDAFGQVNGKLVNATTEQVDAVLEHMLTYRAPKADYRAEVRALEAEVFDVLGGSKWPAFLVGNQARAAPRPAA